MSKCYLQCGESVMLYWFGRVGTSGTIIDLQADVTRMVTSMGQDSGEGKVGDGVGTIVRSGDTFDVFVEIDTGKLWYDDERAY